MRWTGRDLRDCEAEKQRRERGRRGEGGSAEPWGWKWKRRERGAWYLRKGSWDERKVGAWNETRAREQQSKLFLSFRFSLLFLLLVYLFPLLLSLSLFCVSAFYSAEEREGGRENQNVHQMLHCIAVQCSPSLHCMVLPSTAFFLFLFSFYYFIHVTALVLSILTLYNIFITYFTYLQ